MALHALAASLSSFLLFLVQPIVAKRLLPWFGGSAGVWTTCLVFFQVMLLAGYAYGDVLTRRFALRGQAAVHLMVVAASLLLLPIVPPEALKPPDASQPVGRIVLLLLATVGLPYFVLSTTAPLVQAWLARAFPGARVYRLYALSNAASLVALASYPFVIEPTVPARAQANGWSAAYACFAVAILGAAWVTLRRAGRVAPAAAPAAVPGADAAPPRTTQALWFGLAMLGSTLLLAVTAHLTQNVASVPFLWIVPLSVYLLTFVLCFDGRGWYHRRAYTALAAIAAAVMLAGTLPWRLAPYLPLQWAVPLYGACLFVACMWCHGEVAARKPAPAYLTRFYLMLALGGAAGGIFVGVAAPVLFSTYVEIPLALCALAVLAYALAPGRVRLVAAAGTLATAALATANLVVLRAETLDRSRSFYGTLRVRAIPDPVDGRLAMVHGVVIHGEQLSDARRRREPTTYFGPTSGIGRTLAALGPAPRRIGIVGLGVGTLAAYGRRGDVIRFYELDPAVVDEAHRWFSFLDDSPAQIEYVLGDARLSLERAAPEAYDLLVVDAFSSDAIPAHLLTVEAARVYGRHLAPHGVLAFHVTNEYLELGPLVGRLAESLGLEALRLFDRHPDGRVLRTSDWIVATNRPDVLAALRAGGARRVETTAALRPWTDDFNDLFGALKTRRTRPTAATAAVAAGR